MQSLFAAVLLACLLSVINAECPSACSGHGSCGAYDACSCYRNWMSNDCSERVCPFGLAHVDTPMGDLDASSGMLTGPGVTGIAGSVGDLSIIVNDAMYPQGTTEQFPAMKDSNGDVQVNSAHFYRECSNKGMCDRGAGECECFEGYEGSSCQRASCPMGGGGVCNGHGRCSSISEIAADDNENIYRLWDEDITMGCQCDAGYTGADCSGRACKVGADPGYYDDFANTRYTNVTMSFYVMNDDADVYGNYSIMFTDAYGEDWQTQPIDIDANCATIQDRLETLPNDVIPWGTVKCYKSEQLLHVASDIAADGTATTGGHNTIANAGFADAQALATNQFAADGTTPTGESINWNRFGKFNYSVVNSYTLAFSGNLGELKQLQINRYLDGKRPTLMTSEVGAQTLGVHIYSNGFHGENTDYVNDECEGLLVGLSSASVTDTGGEATDTMEKYSNYLVVDTDIEFERLKRCLGDADGISTNNIEVYDWDYGSFMNPHLIKLVDATQDRFTEYVRADGSSYKVLAHGDTPAGGGDKWENFPFSKLCSRNQPWQQDNYNTAPQFKLLEQADLNDASNSGGNVYNRGTHGWCRNVNPPGFFAIIYFDDCTAAGVTDLHGTANAADYHADNTMCSLERRGFRVMTRPATDYALATRFHVYTTKGTMQQVSQHSAAYTQSYEEMYLATDLVHQSNSGADKIINPNFIHSLHSNVIHLQNVTQTGAQGQVDCETAYDFTNGGGRYGNLDCLNKGDKIFLVNIGARNEDACEGARSVNNIGGYTIGATDNCMYTSDAVTYDSNPLYLNMYTVAKIGKVPKDANAADHRDSYMDHDVVNGVSMQSSRTGGLNAEGYRHQIHLNMGVNAMYLATTMEDNRAAQIAAGVFDSKATIYKFHPPALNSTSTTGYNYVAECSNRGLCNSDDGLCECFTGYTGDSCGKMDASYGA